MADMFYPFSLCEAQGRHQVNQWKQSRQLNVKCARHIEDFIAAHSPDGQLELGSAKAMLDHWGFRRVQFVLSNTLLATGGLDFEQDSFHWARSVLIPPDSGNEVFRVQADRPLLAQFAQQTYAEYLKLGLFRPEHRNRQTECGQSYIGKVLILQPIVLAEDRWLAQNQLWYAKTGFEPSSTVSGQTISAICLGDGEKARWTYADFIGVLDEKFLPEWAEEKLAELRVPEQGQDAAPSQKQTDDPAQGGMEMR